MRFRAGQSGSAASDIPSGPIEDEIGTAHESLSPEAQMQVEKAVRAAQEGRLGIIEVVQMIEPQRTAIIERLVQTGITFRLRSLTGKTLRVRYGGAILQVPHRRGGREFMAAHAMHIVIYHGGISKYQQRPEVAEILGDVEDEAEESAAAVAPTAEAAVVDSGTDRREAAETPESTEEDAV